jgi:hypothetical protein
VHGIPGKDLGLDRSLPVDIAVNGQCALKLDFIHFVFCGWASSMPKQAVNE